MLNIFNQIIQILIEIPNNNLKYKFDLFDNINQRNIMLS